MKDLILMGMESLMVIVQSVTNTLKFQDQKLLATLLVHLTTTISYARKNVSMIYVRFALTVLLMIVKSASKALIRMMLITYALVDIQTTTWLLMDKVANPAVTGVTAVQDLLFINV